MHLLNLEWIRNLGFGSKISQSWIPSQAAKRNRDEWFQRQMAKFYPPEVIDDVLSHRRSDYSDEALMKDVMKMEQPYHPIPKDSHFKKALETVENQFRPNRILHPISFPDLRFYPWPLMSSAEAPWTSEDFEFFPHKEGGQEYRDLDFESGLHRLHEGKPSRKLHKFANKVKPSEYVRWKHSVGLATDSRISFRNLFNEMFRYNRPLVHFIKDGLEPFWKDGEPQPYCWNTAHVRSHVVNEGDPDKIRLVLGVPKLVLMIENMFIWIIQACYMNTAAGRMLWGREINRGGWRRIFNEIYSRGPKSTFISADWSGFDRRLLHELIDEVHIIWRKYFDFSKYEPTSWYPDAKPSDPERLERLWNWVCHAVKKTPVLLPDGSLYRWRYNGFASGLQQTQLMDSFANAIMIYTVLSSLGVDVSSKEFWALFQGDDSLIAFCEHMFLIYGNHFLNMMADSALYYFNAVLSFDKSQIQGQCNGMTVLSYSNKFGIATRNEVDLLSHLYFPEYPQDFGRLAASCVGIAEAALGEHPRLHAFCQYMFEKLTKDKRYLVKVNWSALYWMVRAGMFEELDHLKRAEFPDRRHLMTRPWIIQGRTESAKQRLWPFRPKGTNGFHFLNDLK